MSTLKVEIVSIENITPHENADRLSIAHVKGWNVVIGKNEFKVGDSAVYFPVDSVLPPNLENQLFPPDAKIKLTKSRIRSIKIRGAISQGMLVPVVEVMPGLFAEDWDVGTDVTELLGVTKFEPPEPEYQASAKHGVKTGGKAQVNPNFAKYTDIENVKNYPDVFQPGEQVYISEKLHGTSFRAGYVPRHYKDGFWGGVKRWADGVLINLGLKNRQEFVYGSRNVQLQNGKNKSWYRDDPYTKTVGWEDLTYKLDYDEVVYGEIVGDKIQKNYDYGCGPGEYKFYAYDVKVAGRWLSYEEFVHFCDVRGIPRVPELYVGPYSKEVELEHRDGDSTISGQKVREGVVIKSTVESTMWTGQRKVLKSISDAYYLADNSDFH